MDITKTIVILFICFLSLSCGFRIDRSGFNSSNVYFYGLDDVPVESFEYDVSPGLKRATICQINIRELPLRKPLLRNPKTQEILLPDSAGSSVITLKTGEHFEIDCPGSTIVVDETLTVGDLSDAVCVSGTEVSIHGRTVDFTTVVCSKRVASIARYTGQSCFGALGSEVEVGFQFADGHFIRQMTTCFDTETKNVYYSLFDLSHQIGDANTGGTRPAWTEGTIFYNLGVRLDNLYPRAASRLTINRLVGLPDSSTKYVPASGNYYLAKGHFTARTDFIYYAQQEATFHYINSVPQWQSLNGFNWAYLERNVKQYAARNGLDLVVMTGGYGISTLPHEDTGLPVELYLFADENGRRAMPVPKVFWKVVYSPVTRRGIAILGINNPYLDDIQKSIICPDIADDLNWLSFDRTILTRGYIYACTIPELRKLIPQIPNYQVVGILN